MLKRFISSAAQRLGYTIVPNWQLDAYQGIVQTRRLFDLLGIDLVIDIGANTGQFAAAIRQQVGYAGRMASFEPIDALADTLIAQAAADPAWTVSKTAFGAAPGTAEFNVMEDSQFSSFLSPRHDDVALFTEKNRVKSVVAVEITTLDVVLPGLMRESGARNVYLKIDTQGFDLEVLKGADTVLRHVAAMQFEASVRPIYDGAPAYRDIVDYVAGRGFVMSNMFPNNQGSFPQLVEFDCQMIRRDRLG